MKRPRDINPPLAPLPYYFLEKFGEFHIYKRSSTGAAIPLAISDKRGAAEEVVEALNLAALGQMRGAA